VATTHAPAPDVHTAPTTSRSSAPPPPAEDVIAAFGRTVARARDAAIPTLDATLTHWEDATRVTNYERVYRDGLAMQVPDFAGSVGLDFGSWNGFAAHLMQLLGAERVVGVDAVPLAIEQARAWTTALGERRLSFVAADLDDGFSVPLPSDAYDWISVGQVYCAINPGLIDRVLDEMVRLLRPGGTIYLNDSNNPQVPAVRDRLLAMYERHEIGTGTPDAPAGHGFEVRRTVIAEAFPELADDDVARLAAGTAYQWRPEIIAAVDRWRETGEWPDSRFEPGVIRAVVHADIGIAATNPTDPERIAAAFADRGLQCRIASGPGGPFLPEEPAARAEVLARSPGFHLYAVKPAAADPAASPAARDLEFTPYRVTRDTRTPAEEVIAQRHSATAQCFGPDYTAGPGIDKVPSADFDDFLFLLDRLVEMAEKHRLVFRRTRDVSPTHREPDGRIPVLFKHDIDNDIEIALRMAEAQHERGIPATYYVLHTAPYYGRFDADGLFHRFERMMPLYRRIQELGHEVGLHFNPYDLYRDQGLDGAAAMRTELAALRDAGLEIDGAFGHSSAARQGVESIEIFEEHLQHEPEMVRPESARRDGSFVHGGVRQPRLHLSGRHLGLDVFGEFMTRSIGRYSYWSMQSAERWLAAENPFMPRPDDLVGTCSMLRWIRRQVDAPFHIINIHPLAYGLRAGLTAEAEAELRASSPDPSASATASSEGGHDGHGRFPAGVMHVGPAADPDGSPRAGRVCMTPANEIGCLDHPLEPHRGRPGVVLIGGDRFEPRDVQVHASVGGWLRDRLRRSGRPDLTTRVITRAAPPADFIGRAIARATSFGPVAAVVLLLDDDLVTHAGGPAAIAAARRELAGSHPVVVVDATETVRLDAADADDAAPLNVRAILAAADVAPGSRLSADACEHVARAIHAALDPLLPTP
jgi:SAM-dependent methyltransferase